jgi:hypothetical protein
MHRFSSILSGYSVKKKIYQKIIMAQKKKVSFFIVENQTKKSTNSFQQYHPELPLLYFPTAKH